LISVRQMTTRVALHLLTCCFTWVPAVVHGQRRQPRLQQQLQRQSEYTADTTPLLLAQAAQKRMSFGMRRSVRFSQHLPQDMLMPRKTQKQIGLRVATGTLTTVMHSTTGTPGPMETQGLVESVTYQIRIVPLRLSQPPRRPPRLRQRP